MPSSGVTIAVQSARMPIYPEPTRRAIEESGFVVLAKPYRLEQLKAVISRALQCG
jgi:hypothetical protein